MIAQLPHRSSRRRRRCREPADVRNDEAADWLRNLSDELDRVAARLADGNATREDIDRLLDEMADLQRTVFGPPPRAKRGQGARQKILAHLQSHVGEEVTGRGTPPRRGHPGVGQTRPRTTRRTRLRDHANSAAAATASNEPNPTSSGPTSGDSPTASATRRLRPQPHRRVPDRHRRRNRHARPDRLRRRHQGGHPPSPRTPRRTRLADQLPHRRTRPQTRRIPTRLRRPRPTDATPANGSTPKASANRSSPATTTPANNATETAKRHSPQATAASTSRYTTSTRSPTNSTSYPPRSSTTPATSSPSATATTSRRPQDSRNDDAANDETRNDQPGSTVRAAGYR